MIRRLLHVALTRVRNKLVLEWPGYLVGKDNTAYWSILTGDCDLTLDEDMIRVGEQDFLCTAVDGQTELPDDLDIDSVPED